MGGWGSCLVFEITKWTLLVDIFPDFRSEFPLIGDVRVFGISVLTLLLISESEYFPVGADPSFDLSADLSSDLSLPIISQCLLLVVISNCQSS